MRLPSLPPAQRLALLNACAAIYGLSIAFALLPFWYGSAQPGQLPGLATAIGMNAHAPFRFVAGLIILPIVLPLLLRPLLQRLSDDTARTWAGNLAAFGMLAAFWMVVIRRDVWWTVVPSLIAVIVAFVLRRFEARFTRWDAMLIPTFSMLFIAGNDALHFDLERLTACAVGAVLVIRLIVAFLRRHSSIPPALYFALAPLGFLLQAHFNARDLRYNGWPPLLFGVLSPFVLALLLRDTPTLQRRMRIALAFVIYPLVVFGHMSATSVEAAEGAPRATIFEDGHHLVPANEMLRGEKPFRDIVPAHGFGQDALVDYLALKAGRDTRGVLNLRGLLSAMNAMLLYMVVAVITRSPNAALLTFLISAALGAAGGTPRSIPALLFVAALGAAVVRRRPRQFAWAGAMVSLATLTSVDYGAYTFLTLVVMLFRAEKRLESLRWSAVGVAAVAGPAMLWFAIQGVAIDFVRTTFFEVLTLGPVYTLTPFEPPAGFEKYPYLPEALLAVFDRTAFLHVTWALTVVLVGVVFAMPRPAGSPRRRARVEAMLVIAVFTVITALSYAERQHLYNHVVVGPLIGIAIFFMFRARLAAVRRLAPIAVLLALMCANTTLHLVIISMVRGARGPLEQHWRAPVGIPRAARVLFAEHDATRMETAKKYVDRLPPDTTWFDFTNHGGLYYFFDRDCPIRQIEVAFYETDERQLDVIRRIEANPKIVAAMIPRQPDIDTVDGVSNAERAPLVWQYLQAHFEPEFEEGDVVFWRRR